VSYVRLFIDGWCRCLVIGKAVQTLFRELHWLKVPERIRFRLCVLAYRCLCFVITVQCPCNVSTCQFSQYIDDDDDDDNNNNNNNNNNYGNDEVEFFNVGDVL